MKLQKCTQDIKKQQEKKKNRCGSSKILRWHGDTAETVGGPSGYQGQHSTVIPLSCVCQQETKGTDECPPALPGQSPCERHGAQKHLAKG